MKIETACLYSNTYKSISEVYLNHRLKFTRFIEILTRQVFTVFQSGYLHRSEQVAYEFDGAARHVTAF